MRQDSVILERILVPQRGQAQGLRIHPTPHLVPTGRRGAPMTRFARHNSSGMMRSLKFTRVILVIARRRKIMAIKTYGLMGVDWEERANFERLRNQRLARIKKILKESELG